MQDKIISHGVISKRLRKQKRKNMSETEVLTKAVMQMEVVTEKFADKIFKTPPWAYHWSLKYYIEQCFIYKKEDDVAYTVNTEYGIHNDMILTSP